MKVNRVLVEDALGELADRAYQSRVWSGSEPSIMSSFSECVEALFDDSGLALAMERGTVFGAPIDAKLRRLSRTVGAVDGSQPVAALLEDEALRASRALAGEVLDDIRRSVSRRPDRERIQLPEVDQ